ncbi:MAG: hypothetical protein V2A61_06180, partial [Calditrichota bacterium]
DTKLGKEEITRDIPNVGEEARKAIEGLNEYNLGGRNLMVNEARDRDSRPPRPGFIRGGGRGR